MTCEPIVHRESTPRVMKGINRRTLGMVGVATLASNLVAPAGAQEMPPTPDNLERELPSPRQAPRACAELSELPTPQAAGASERLFPGFRVEAVQTSGATIRVLSKGSGPPLLLIHGHPYTHVTWHKVAPALTDSYTIIAPDLRGYGGSSKPPYSARSQDYSFRVMAQDMVEV